MTRDLPGGIKVVDIDTCRFPLNGSGRALLFLHLPMAACCALASDGMHLSGMDVRAGIGSVYSSLLSFRSIRSNL